MTINGGDDHLEDFIEDERAPTLDPDDYYIIQQVASGLAAPPEDDHASHWNSLGHYVGRFWIIAPRNESPELVSYRLKFADAEHQPEGVMLPRHLSEL